MKRKLTSLAGLGLLLLVLLPTGGVLQAQGTPDTPANLRIAIAKGEVVARWDAVEDAATYRLLLSAPIGQNGSNEVRVLVVRGSGTPPTSIAIPGDYLVPGITVRLRLTAVSSADESSSAATLSFDPRSYLDRLASSAAGEGRNDHNGIPIGAMGWIFRENDTLTIYQVISPTEAVPALALTPAELNEVGVPETGPVGVKASDDGRIVIVAWPNEDLVISMGPNPEGKVLHTVLEGGMFGSAAGPVTTWDSRPPAGEWQLPPRLA
ncbi:MAG: hypothetical protein OXF44_13505 [Anaerolineaceae bacterium]|nr:hypothetical protein [Anaerolineaceae bacterium]